MAEFGIGTLSEVFSGLGGWGQLIYVALMIALIVGAFLLIIFLFYPVFLYPNILNIRSLRNDVLQYIGRGYGKTEQSQDGKVRFKVWRFLKPSTYIEPPPNEYKQAYSRNRVVIDYIEDNAGNLRPMKVDLDPKTDELIFRAHDKDVHLWGSLARRVAFEIYKQKPGFWDQYGNYVLNATFLIFVFVFMLVLQHDFKEIAAQFQSVASTLKEVITSLTAVFPK